MALVRGGRGIAAFESISYSFHLPPTVQGWQRWPASIYWDVLVSWFTIWQRRNTTITAAAAAAAPAAPAAAPAAAAATTAGAEAEAEASGYRCPHPMPIRCDGAPTRHRGDIAVTSPGHHRDIIGTSSGHGSGTPSGTRRVHSIFLLSFNHL